MIYNKKVLIGLTQQNDKLEFARRAGGQVVRKICVVVSARRRSVSFYGSINWNLEVCCYASIEGVGMDV